MGTGRLLGSGDSETRGYFLPSPFLQVSGTQIFRLPRLDIYPPLTGGNIAISSPS